MVLRCLSVRDAQSNRPPQFEGKNDLESSRCPLWKSLWFTSAEKLNPETSGNFFQGP